MRVLIALALSLVAWPLTPVARAQDARPEPSAEPPTGVPFEASPEQVPEPPAAPSSKAASAGAASEPAPLHRGNGAPGPETERAPHGEAGWFPDEGFLIRSSDGQNELHIGLQTAWRFSPQWLNGQAQPRADFFVLRPILSGSVFREWIRFWISMEWGVSNPSFLLDAYVSLQPWEAFGVIVGQQCAPISRHELQGPHQLLFPDWSMVANYFWPGRDKGVTLLGTLADGKLDYWAGLYSGTPLRQLTSLAGTWHAEGRITINPLGAVDWEEFPYILSEQRLPTRLSFSFAGMAADYVSSQENFNPDTFVFDVTSTGERRKEQMGVADVWLQGARFVVFAEGYLRRSKYAGSRPFLSTGVWGEAGYMLVDRYLDVGARFNWLNPSDHLVNDRAYVLEGQLGYYPFRSIHLVTRLRYGYGHQQQPNQPVDELSPVTLLLPPGDSHVLTLQLFIAI